MFVSGRENLLAGFALELPDEFRNLQNEYIPELPKPQQMAVAADNVIHISRLRAFENAIVGRICSNDVEHAGWLHALCDGVELRSARSISGSGHANLPPRSTFATSDRMASDVTS